MTSDVLQAGREAHDVPVAKRVEQAFATLLGAHGYHADPTQQAAIELLLGGWVAGRLAAGVRSFPAGRRRASPELMAAAPLMSIYPILSARYGLEGRCAAGLVVATVLSFLSVSVSFGRWADARWIPVAAGRRGSCLFD